jgi:hypothetical protein
MYDSNPLGLDRKRVVSFEKTSVNVFIYILVIRGVVSDNRLTIIRTVNVACSSPLGVISSLIVE